MQKKHKQRTHGFRYQFGLAKSYSTKKQLCWCSAMARITLWELESWELNYGTQHLLFWSPSKVVNSFWRIYGWSFANDFLTCPFKKVSKRVFEVRKSSVLWRCWLGGRKGIRPVKNWVVGCWRGYLSGARCRFAYGPADATATHYLLLQ